MEEPPGHASNPKIPTVSAHTGPVTFEDLWAEAAGRPGQPALGLISDSWAGFVGCAIQFDGTTGAVVLDFPADRLLEAIHRHAGEEGWYVTRQEAHPAGDHRHAMRYVITLALKTPVQNG